MSVTAGSSSGFRKLLRWMPLALLLILVLAVAAFIWWAGTPTGALMPEVEQAMVSDERITVTTRGWIAFIPQDSAPAAGFILYPGGRVQPEAYAPLARRIAEEGYLAVIVPVPLNLAFFGINAADAVINNYSAVSDWVVGGHSLGGVAAAIYAASHLQTVDGLVLMGSYPADGTLASSDLPVLSLYGSNDQLADPQRVLDSAALLPPSARFVEITGGNHSQFGYYGFQSGDGEATISYAEQTEQITEQITLLLEQIAE